MKRLLWWGAGFFLFLVISTQVPATDDVIEQAHSYFTADEIERGAAFAWQRRWIFWGSVSTQMGWLIVLAITPLGSKVYRATETITKQVWMPWLLVMFAIYWVGSWLLSLPFRWASRQVSLAWEMTSQPFDSWFTDQMTGLGVGLILDGIAVAALYVAMRYAGRGWWLVAGLGAVVLTLGYAILLPEVVAPLTNTFTPLKETEWHGMEPRIRAMAQRVGSDPQEIYVVDASRQSHHDNAYFTGVGPYQRIVLYDNLLKKYPENEVLTIIAHEMGHWWHRHILQGIALGGVAVTLGLLALSWHLNREVQAGTLDHRADPAGLFMILLIGQVVLALAMPLGHAVSRRMERQADDAALALSRDPQAFIDAEIRLARLNKSNVAPSRWNVLLFATHPPVVERIQAAERWKP